MEADALSRGHILVTPEIGSYLEQHGMRDRPEWATLRAITATHPRANMQINPLAGQFMAWLVGALGVRRVLEIGTFTGYSAMVMAQALGPDGRVVCLDVSEEFTAIARVHWEAAGLSDRITLHLAPALETLARFRALGEVPFDLAFIDADKENYAAYVDHVHALLRPGGVVLVDNVLWSGSVADPEVHDPETDALRDLNAQLARDPRWDLVMLPIADGLTLLRKL